jgi:hypothetical protein
MITIVVLGGLGFLAYCLIAGVCYVWFGEGGLEWQVPEMPAAIWPIILVVMGPAYLGRRLTENFDEVFSRHGVLRGRFDD